jgi:2-polyprenyl-6-methoxyphenol hydroxylase-like FAD-dependent oxidoreductase
MEKQKICIIGGSLTGLVTAISLSKLNCEIDLIAGNSKQNTKSNRTIALSEGNFNFLNKLNISKFIKKETWICSKMKLYSENRDKKLPQIFELNNENKEKKILYMLENSKLMKLMMTKIKRF